MVHNYLTSTARTYPCPCASTNAHGGCAYSLVIVTSALLILHSLYEQHEDIRCHIQDDKDTWSPPFELSTNRLTSISTQEYLQHVESALLHHATNHHSTMNSENISSKSAVIGRHTLESVKALKAEVHAGNHQIDADTYTVRLTCVFGVDHTSFSISYDETHHGTRSAEHILEEVYRVASQLRKFSSSSIMLRHLNLLGPLDIEHVQKYTLKPKQRQTRCIDGIILQRATRCPGSPAVHSWDGDLTYNELERLSKNLASHVTSKLGYQKTIVPILCEKSMWTVVAMLAVLQSGNAFLLLDTGHPDTRLRQILEVVNPSIILSSKAQQARAQDLVPRVAVISEVSTQFVRRNSKDALTPRQPDDLAVIVFTSGTTGRPRAVALEHASICTSLLTLAEVADLTPSTRFYQFSSYAWDAAYGEMLLTLMSGGCICIPSEEQRMNCLAQSITELGANTILLTPTVLGLLRPQAVPSLKTVITGGEKATADLVRTWVKRVNFVTAYGPAECAVVCMANRTFNVNTEAAFLGSCLGCRVWITVAGNPDQLAPLGVVGELLVEGQNVARGYLNDESKTKASFFTDTPEWMHDLGIKPIPNARFYRTGDLVRYDIDGKIIFVGRKDRQIKLRGQRIELEEVQCQINEVIKQEGAQAVVDVLSCDDDGGAQSLAAFVYLHPSHAKDESNESQTSPVMSEQTFSDLITTFSALITNNLPAYMLPSVWIPIASIPRTASGKLDRRALQTLGHEHLEALKANAITEDDLTPTQSDLACVWQEVLSVSQPSLDSEFFHLGGDSVKAMKLVASARQRNMKLLIKDVFQNTSLRSMATKVDILVGETNTNPHITTSDESCANAVFDLTQDLLGRTERDILEVFPCTSLQEGIYAASLTNQGSYISQFVIPIPEECMVGPIKAAWRRTKEDFPILNSFFVPGTTGMLQALLRDPLDWKVSEDSLEEYLKLDGETSFTAGDVLARYCLVYSKSLPKVHLVWTMHHAIFDGWSIEKILGRVRAHLGKKVPVAKREEAKSFRHFVNHCQMLSREAAETFWTQQLQGASAPSFPAISTIGFRPTDNSILSQSAGLFKSSRPGTTVTVLARAALAILLSKYEGNDDVLFANTLHGRQALPAELQDIVGPTIATLPIRTRVDPGVTVSSFLASVQNQLVDMMPYEQYGLASIRGLSPEMRAVLSLRILLVIQSTDALPCISEGVETREANRCLHEFALVITIIQTTGGWRIQHTFDDRLITANQASIFARNFEQTLSQLCIAESDTLVRNLHICSEEDVAIYLEDNENVHLPVQTSVAALFEEQTRRNPQGLALDSWDGAVTYEVLDRLSNNVASALVRKGVKPDMIVGHCYEKSMWAIVSLIGIIKTGSAFSPLSPGQPAERLSVFLQKTGVSYVVCSARQQQSLAQNSWQTVVIDEQTLHSSPSDPRYMPSTIDSSSLAYILQTSGTTGEPKAFAVRHVALATGIVTRASSIPRGSGMRVLQFGPYNFRLGIENILATLCTGGCICVPSDLELMNDLAAYMRRAKINFANVTPSIARTLKPHQVPGLEILLLSGEPPDSTLVATWSKSVQLINGYGPSEFAAKQTLNFNMSEEEPLNLGHAIGANLWVVDQHNLDRLCPIGAEGELLIEGPTLADGYVGQPEETMKRFLTAPEWHRKIRSESDQSTVLFRTGDLVRRNADGTHTILGRADGQLKISGQKFEAGEVERHLQECFDEGSTVGVVVDVVQFEGQTSQVVAAFVSAQQATTTGSLQIQDAFHAHVQRRKTEVLKTLSRLLPGYMIPHVIVGISSIPVTSNGKVNRRAIREFASTVPITLINDGGDKGRAKRCPESESEKTLNSLWCQVLALPAHVFDVDDDFFQMGGNSMSAIRLVAAARAIGMTLNAQSTFRFPVLRDMAIQLSHTVADLGDQHKAGPHIRFDLLKKTGCDMDEFQRQLQRYGIQESQVEDAFPLIPLAQHYIRLTKATPGAATGQHIFPIPEHVDLDRLETALSIIWNSTEALRLRCVEVAGQLVQVVCNTELSCHRMNGDLETCFKRDLSLSWATGVPLNRFCLVIDDEGGGKSRHLVWTGSHATWDGWSRRLIIDAVDFAYRHGHAPSGTPRLRDFIHHTHYGNKPASDFMVQEYYGRKFMDPFHVNLSERIPVYDNFSTTQITLPKLEGRGGTSIPTLLLAAWTLVIEVIEDSQEVLTSNYVSGRDAPFSNIESLSAMTLAFVPLCVPAHPGTIREHAVLVQKHVVEGSAVQHSPKMYEELSTQLRLSAYQIIVYPGDEHEERTTETLGLQRSEFRFLERMAHPCFVCLILHPGERMLDFELFGDTQYVSAEKAGNVVKCLEFAINAIFERGGLESSTALLQQELRQLMDEGGCMSGAP